MTTENTFEVMYCIDGEKSLWISRPIQFKVLWLEGQLGDLLKIN